MARPWDLGPRVQNFSALANLGSQFTGAYDAARKRVREEDDQAIFATAAQGGDLNKLGMSLLGRGRVQEGAALLSLGQKAAEQQREAEWFKSNSGVLNGGGGSSPAAIPVVAAPKQGVHVAENEDDVQRLERATGMVTTDADRQAIVKTVYGEAANQPAVGQQAVAAVIRNRANQAGLTPEQITQQPNQFEPWNTEAGRARMNGIPEQRFAQIAGTVAPVIDQGLDPTGGATHFYAPKAQAALGRAAPRWDNGTGNDIADHRFFNLGYGQGGGVPAPAPQAIIASAPGEANAQTAQAAPQAIPGDDPVRLRQEAAYYARSNPEAARQLSARADAAEQARGVQTAQNGDPNAPAPGAAEAQFIIPGTTPQQTQAITQDRQVQNLLRALDGAPEKFKPGIQKRLDLRIEELKQARGEEGRVLETEIKREQLAKARRDNASTAAPTTKVVKQADGSEVAVQWDADNRRWIPLAAPEGGNAVRPAGTKLTEGQSKDLVYHTRGLQALEAFEPVAGAYASGPERAIVQLPGGNYAVSEEFQMARQAGRNFLASILRKDTGAAITAQEEQQYGEVFLPTPGDKPGTIAQKAEARKQAIDAIRGGLGTAEVLAIGQRLVKRGPGDAAPEQTKAEPKQGAPKAVATPQDYQSLKPGEQYTDPQGNIRTKR